MKYRVTKKFTVFVIFCTLALWTTVPAKLEEEKNMVKEDARLGLRPMTDGPVDVKLRWANLRAREHHVKGPKKSPRKMVLRKLILRKAEEAKRTTTWAPYRVQCPCLQCQNQPRWILLNFPSVDMGTLSKTVGFSLYPSHWVLPELQLQNLDQTLCS